MGFGSHDSSVGNPEIEAADEKMQNNGHVLDTGGAQLVTMGDIPSLVRLQAQAIWEMSVYIIFRQPLSTRPRCNLASIPPSW